MVKYFFIAFALLFICSPSLASVKKLAFVVGIGQYDNLREDFQLKNPVPDSAAIARTFTTLQYEVTHKPNLTSNEFDDQLRLFLAGVDEGDTVVLFLSGHGIEIEGVNYLLPRDVEQPEYGRESRLKRSSIKIEEMLLDLRKKKPGNAIMILDACRKHPLIPSEYDTKAFPGIQSAGINTKATLASSGEMHMFSASSGQEALDSLPNDEDKELSLYVRTLLPLLTKPEITIEELNTELQNTVYKEARAFNHAQRPAFNDELVGDFCFAGCPVVDEPIAPPVVEPISPPAIEKNLNWCTSNGVACGLLGVVVVGAISAIANSNGGDNGDGGGGSTTGNPEVTISIPLP